jgi:hypothetical protein
MSHLDQKLSKYLSAYPEFDITLPHLLNKDFGIYVLAHLHRYGT